MIQYLCPTEIKLVIGDFNSVTVANIANCKPCLRPDSGPRITIASLQNSWTLFFFNTGFRYKMSNKVSWDACNKEWKLFRSEQFSSSPSCPKATVLQVSNQLGSNLRSEWRTFCLMKMGVKLDGLTTSSLPSCLHLQLGNYPWQIGGGTARRLAHRRKCSRWKESVNGRV